MSAPQRAAIEVPRRAVSAVTLDMIRAAPAAWYVAHVRVVRTEVDATMRRSLRLSLLPWLLSLGCGSTVSSGADAALDHANDAASDVATDAGDGARDAPDDAAADGGRCPVTAAPTPDSVLTEQGVLRGVVDGATRSFKGVPYAAPPVGALRWRPPAAPACYGAVRDALSYGSACPQLDAGGAFTGDEDCLTLNVWTPTGAAGPLPVLFFMHGGGNFQGSSAELTAQGTRIYDGAWLAEHGPAVVVTINYRLGVLGFLAHPALASEDAHHSTGDYGLLDQIAALGWVHRNIASFGGDPSRVMLFGESAGGLDTCALLASPLAEGLFSRALVESGGCVAATSAVAQNGGTMLAANAMCAGSADVLACLRALSTDAVVRALPGTTGLIPGAAGYRYQPVVDGYVLPEAPLAAIAAGRRRQVPVIVGTNRDEHAFFYPPTMGRGMMTDAQYRAMVMAQFPMGYVAALALYPSAAFPSPYFAYVDMISDATFTCPTRTIARSLLMNSTQPVRRYLFTRGLTGAAAAYGAAHAFELPYVFHNLPPGSTTDQAQLADAMAGYWTRFAATGDPNGGGAPSWPAYDATSDPYLQFDATITAGQRLSALRCDAWDRVTP